MVLSPKRQLPPYLANVKAGTALSFHRLSGPFVTDHRSMTPVSVIAAMAGSDVKALIFRTTLTEDLDGAPDAYAPPTGALAPFTIPSSGKVVQVVLVDRAHCTPTMQETSLKNATNRRDPDPVFFLNPLDNPNPDRFTWAGVRSAPSGGVDARPFLQDVNGNFPVLGAGGFYVSQTAINTRDGRPVNALTVPYGALSDRLALQGGVKLGDVGLAIRSGSASTGTSSPFLYADAGGGGSHHLGECSRRLIQNMGGAITERICYVVFPGSGPRRGVAEPDLMEAIVWQRLHDLGTKYENAAELAWYLTYPEGWAPGAPALAAPAAAAFPTFEREYFAVRHQLGVRGFPPGQSYYQLPPVKPNRLIF